MTIVATPAAELDRRALRSILGGFATGVVIVTATIEGEPSGMTANSFTSVSLDPPLVLVCFDPRGRTFQAVESGRRFVVNILDRDQGELSDRFARPGDDHFDGLDHDVDDAGVPVLRGGLGHLSCEVEMIHTAGDHEVVIGRLCSAAPRSGRPLLFHRGRYGELIESDGNQDG